MLVVSEKHESEQSWCKSLPFSDQQWDQQGNLIVCFSEAQQWPWNTHREAISWRSSGHTWQHVPQISKQTSTKTCSRWWRAEKKTNLRDVRVPINVADVVIWQASKEIDQMLQRWMTTCYTGKTETLTTTHQVIFFNKSSYVPLPSLEDFAQKPISWSTRQTTACKKKPSGYKSRSWLY